MKIEIGATYDPESQFETEVTVPGKAFPLLKFPRGLADAIQAIPQADGDNGDGDKTSATAGYRTCKIEQPLLDHLPEGSH